MSCDNIMKTDRSHRLNRWAAGSRKPEAGNRKQETGNRRKPEARNSRKLNIFWTFLCSNSKTEISFSKIGV